MMKRLLPLGVDYSARGEIPIHIPSLCKYSITKPHETLDALYRIFHTNILQSQHIQC